MTESQEALVSQFRAGDFDAFRSLVSPHLGAMRGRAARWLDCQVRKKVSLLDVVQDAQLVAFERRATFVPGTPEAFGNWLLGIVDNCARQTIEHFTGVEKRDAGRELSGEQRPPTRLLAGHGPTPSQDVVGAERRRLLREARATLPPEDQALLHLVYDERLKITEAAARLGRSYEAVKKQHARALLRLGEAFSRRWSSDHGSDPIERAPH